MRIAVAGLGNVGAAVVRLLQMNKNLLIARGADLTVCAVSARDKAIARSCDLSSVEWVDDPHALAARADIEVVVEVIGGAEGVALELVTAALNNGKHVVTANKAMIATHGIALALLAETSRLQLSFEAAVCGGVPTLKILREGLAANRISSVRGILNGTCNYVLTRMATEGLAFNAALAEAQRLGYAEADPAADIDGHDTANKLAILAALAFGVAPNVASIPTKGIRSVTQADIREAASRGGTIRLLGIGKRDQLGITQKVEPVFIPNGDPLFGINGVTNAIQISGDFAGDILVQGPGAGGDVTASAIVADLVDIARGHRGFAFGVLGANLQKSSN
jgi:homoserine dehydrogenase